MLTNACNSMRAISCDCTQAHGIICCAPLLPSLSLVLLRCVCVGGGIVRGMIQTGVFHTATVTGDFLSMEDICFGGNPGNDDRRGCRHGYVCAMYDHTPNDETVSFDDIWNSLCSSFRVVFRDQWMLTMWFVQDGTHKSMWVPFFSLFFIANFALVNLFPGAMMTSLQTTVRQEENEKRREADLKGDDDEAGGGGSVRTDFELLLEAFEEAYQQDLKHTNDFLEGKEHVAEMTDGSDLVAPRCTPNWLPFCKDLRRWIESPFGAFAYFIYFIIFLMVVTLMVDGYNAHPRTTKVCAALNIFYVTVFMVEFLIKILVLGPYAYFGDKFNILDFVLVLFGIVDLAVESVLSGTKALRVVRVFRLARVARIASLSKVVKLQNSTPSIDLIRMVEILSEAGQFIVNVFFLLLFFTFLFTLTGMQLFGGKDVFNGEKSRFNFDSFNNAFMTVFSMTTGSTGYAIFMNVAYTMRSNIVFIFYIIWQVLAKYFLLATVAATLFQRIEEDALNYMKKMARTTMQACYLMDRSVMRAWRAIAFRKWRDMMFRASGRQVIGAFVHVKEDDSAVTKAQEGAVAAFVKSPKSYGLFDTNSGARIVAAEIDSSTAFELVSIAVVILACVCLAAFAEEESGGRIPNARETVIITSLSTFTTLFFVLEFAIKTVHMGVYLTPKAYLSSWLNRIDAFATLCAVVALLSGDAAAGFLSIFRVLRVLQPVRLINKVKPLRRVLVALYESWKQISNVALVSVGTWCLFALIGMQFFGGYFNRCSDPAFPQGAHRHAAVFTDNDSFPNGCSGSYYDSKNGLLSERQWVSAYLNFDDFPSALYCALTIFSLDGWESIYFSAVDGVDPNKQPVRNTNKAYAAYFILLILISFVAIQMIVGAMYGAFMYLNCTAGGTRISSLKVAFWQIYATKLRYIEPLAEPTRPASGPRLNVYLAVRSPLYAKVVMFLTFVSIAMRFLYWGTEGAFQDAPTWLRILDFVFAVAYFGEWLLRYWAFGWRGVTLVWYDKGDTIVTLVVLVYGFLDMVDMQPGMEVWATLGYEMHSFLTGCVSLRLFRLIRFMHHTHAVLLVVRKSMSTLVAMAVLTAVLTFAYAIVGVALFGQYSSRFDIGSDLSILSSDIYNHEFSNFERVVPCMQLLYFIGTGGEFAGVMQQLTTKTPPNLRWFGPVYILSYLILVKYVIYSVCVLVVVYKFTIHATDVNGLAMEAIVDFQRVWQERDPYASGEIPMKEYPGFVRSLKLPLGVRATDSHLEVDRYIKKSLLVMGFQAADIVGPTEDLPYTVRFKKSLVALHFLVIFGDSFGEDPDYFRRRVVARNRIRQFKYGVASYIVKLREQAGGATHESATGVKDLSLMRSLLPRVFEQRLLKSCMHEIYRLRCQIQYKGYTSSADREVDLIVRTLREEYESAALQNRRLGIEIDAVVDKFSLEVTRKRNMRYLSLLRQLVRQITDERERHLMRTWKLDTMQLHSKFRVRDPVVKVAVSEMGDFLFTASSLKIHAWRMKKASAPASAPLYALSWGAKQTANVLSLVCTADAKRFFSGHDDWAIRSWQEDVRGKGRKVKHSGKFSLLLLMRGHEGPVYDLKMYEGYLLSCGGDSTVRFWRARSEETLQSASLAGGMDMGFQVPGFGTGIFCMSTFRPILDMNKYTEKDVVSQLLVGTSDGQVAALVLQTDNAFLFARQWEASATVQVSDSEEKSPLAALNPLAAAASSVAVTSVVCPNRFGDSWELCFAGTSSGQIKIYEMLWHDPEAGSKREVTGFRHLWTHNVHSAAVSMLVPAGGWMWSSSHDMSVVAWREPTRHAAGVSQGHEDGYVAHSGRVTAMAATDEMIYSVDDSGVLLVRNSREKNEVKFIDGEGARVVSKLSETARARMVHDLKQAYVGRKTFSLILEDYTKESASEYADLLVPDIWMDSRNPEAAFAPPKFLDAALRDEALTHWTFLGQLCRHYFPKREIDREIPLEVRRWIESRRALAKKNALKSEANMASSDDALNAAAAANPENRDDPTAKAELSTLVNANKDAPEEDASRLPGGKVQSVGGRKFVMDDGSAQVSVDLSGWVVQLAWRDVSDKTGRWLLEEACKAYFNAKGEGVDSNQLVPKESMVELPLDLPLKDTAKPNAQLVAMVNGLPPKSYRAAKLTVDLVFRKIGAEGSDMRKQWEVQFKKELADSMGGVKPSRIQILSLESAGGVVVNFKLFSEPGNHMAKSPTELFGDFERIVASGDLKIAGGDVAPGKFGDKTKELAIVKVTAAGGLFGMVGAWLPAIMGGVEEDSDSEEEVDEGSLSDESEYSDGSDVEAAGEGFGDEGDVVNPMASPGALSKVPTPGGIAYDDEDDTSSLALSVAERGRKNRKARGKGQAARDFEKEAARDEEKRKGNLMSWMGISGLQGIGGVVGGVVGGGDAVSVVSSGTVASSVALDGRFDDEGSEMEEEDEEGDFDGVEATEMVDLQAMDDRMESLNAWAKSKRAEKALAASSGQKGARAPPKDNMKRWVAAKAQVASGGGGAESQSLREWLLFDVALDHNATEEVEQQLREAGFDSLAALTSPYAVINDRALKEMGIRKMGHRAQLLAHLDGLRGKAGAGLRAVVPDMMPAGGVAATFQAEYGLAARLQAMEVEREREREERERQLAEIAELKDVVLHALQDPEKRAGLQAQQRGKVGQLLSLIGVSAPRDEVKDLEDGDYDDDLESVYSGSSAASSALAGSVGSAAEAVGASLNQTAEEAARSGKEIVSGTVFGISLGRTKLRGGWRDGIEWVTAVVTSYKHPYFTVQYETGETEYLTLVEVQQQLAADSDAAAAEEAAARAEESSEDEDSGDE